MVNIDRIIGELEDRGVSDVTVNETDSVYRLHGEFDGSKVTLQSITPREAEIADFKPPLVAFEVPKGGSLAPSIDVPDQTLSPDFGGMERGEYESVKADDESDVCDCDPKHKDSQVIQHSAGANFGPIGGSGGTGKTVVVCKNCLTQYEVDTESSDSGLGLFDP